MHNSSEPQHVDQPFYAKLQDKVWLESELVRSWSVNDPKLFADLLKSPEMLLPGLAHVLDHLEAKTGKPLKHLRRVSKMIPIMLDGADHAALRRTLAVYLSRKAVLSEQILPEALNACLAPLQIAGVVDVHHQVVEPLITQFMSLLAGKSLPHEMLSLRLDLILIINKSPSQVIDLDRRFGIAFDFFEDDCTDVMDMACRICCLLFGSETLVMMLVENILSAIAMSSASHPAVLPEFPTESGVPLTWRRASRDTNVGGCPVRAGDNVKIRLQAAAYSEKPAIRNVIFGSGLHSCIGKQISLVIWEQFVARFNALKIYGRLGTYDSIVEPHMRRYNKAEVEIL
jgi:cytochrome P450